MDKKISTGFAITIIFLIAGFFIMVILLNSKKTNLDQVTNIPSQTAIKSEVNKIESNNEDIKVPERISGVDCYKKEDNGIINDFEFRQDFNTSNPTKTVRYVNAEREISFNIQFNPNWGNKDCKVEPYIEFKQPNGNTLVEFGKPRAGMVSEFLLTTSKYRSAEDIIDEQKNGEPNPNPRKKMIGNKNIVIYESYGMTTERIYEVIGKDYNYSFSHSDVNKLSSSSIKSLEDIIASINFIDSN